MCATDGPELFVDCSIETEESFARGSGNGGNGNAGGSAARRELIAEDVDRYLRHLHGDDIFELVREARKFERMVKRLERASDVAALRQLATRILSVAADSNVA